jgi:hypothetical protein
MYFRMFLDNIWRGRNFFYLFMMVLFFLYRRNFSNTIFLRLSPLFFKSFPSDRAHIIVDNRLLYLVFFWLILLSSPKGHVKRAFTCFNRT